MAVRTFGKSDISYTHLFNTLSRVNYHKSSGASASGDVAPLPPVPLSVPSLLT
ncbi:hypothetical protein PENSPDRAFT_654496, partial [Peniophora sp. CONT]